MKKPRDYRKATLYEEQPAQVKHREERNRARAALAKTRSKPLSGDVGHKKPLAGGGSNAPSNVHVESVAKNRGWRKGRHGYSVPTEK